MNLSTCQPLKLIFHSSGQVCQGCGGLSPFWFGLKDESNHPSQNARWLLHKVSGDLWRKWQYYGIFISQFKAEFDFQTFSLSSIVASVSNFQRLLKLNWSIAALPRLRLLTMVLRVYRSAAHPFPSMKARPSEDPKELRFRKCRGLLWFAVPIWLLWWKQNYLESITLCRNNYCRNESAD